MPPKTEMRTLLPNNAVVYLETNDLAKTLESLTESPAFQELAERKPDFSFLRQMQIAAAVTKISGAEKQISDKNAVISFTPQFVAVAETHLWSWQTASFVENQLDNFVRKNYGEATKLKITEKESGKFYEWTAIDNRQVFAYARESLIYFGTDAAAIENCIRVKKGETDNLLKNEALTRVYTANNMTFGYVSTEGIKEISDFAAVSLAVEATEETTGRSFIARLLPELLQNSAREIIWTANKTERGIEDKFYINSTEKLALVAGETLAPAQLPPSDAVEFLPADIFSATRYNLQNPLLAWRSLLFVTAENSDALSRRFLLEFSGRLLEPYKISDAETFLSLIEPEIFTVQFDQEGEKTVAIVAVKDKEKIKKAISQEINFKSEPEKNQAEIWFATDKTSAAAFVENKLILGDSRSVLQCLQAKQSGEQFIKTRRFRGFAENQATAVTIGKEVEAADKIVRVLANKTQENRKLATFYSTETRFTKSGIERQTISDFGLLGMILQQLKP